MHQRQQAPQRGEAVAQGQHVQQLGGREVAGGPEGDKPAPVADQLLLTELGLGLPVQTVRT